MSDELTELKTLIERRKESNYLTCQEDICVISEESARIKARWTSVLFSRNNDDSLRRYFRYHLKEICALINDLNFLYPKNCSFVKDSELELLGLLQYLREYCPRYFDENALSPRAHTELFFKRIRPKDIRLQMLLNDVSLATPLKLCLLSYPAEMSAGGPGGFTFRALAYFELWLDRLLTIDFKNNDPEQEVACAMLQLNFNHLGYFAVIREQIMLRATIGMDNSTYYSRVRCSILSEPVMHGVIYHPDWPGLNLLLGNWLTEEIVRHERDIHKTIEKEEFPKLALNLSVAQLACLIRHLHEQNIFCSSNLTEIFKFFAANFQTKRQPDVSSGSLRKEFYGVDQVTAAGVMGMLQKMVSNIKLKFFPVWIAVSVVVDFFAGIH